MLGDLDGGRVSPLDVDALSGEVAAGRDDAVDLCDVRLVLEQGRIVEGQ